MLRNDVIAALLQRDATAADRALQQLVREYPADDLVPALSILVHALDEFVLAALPGHDALRRLRAELVGVGADTALRLYIRPIGIFRAVRVMRLGCNRLKHFLFPGPITPRSARNMRLFRIFSIVEGVLGCPFGVLLQDSPLFFFRRGKGPRNWSRLR